MKILYLEDDKELSQTVEELLLEENYEVAVAHSGEEVINLTYKNSFDINLPDINGFELLKSLRASGIETATIFTTSLQSIENISKAYLAGADDYISKPFFMDELLFRIKAILKRELKSQESVIHLSEDMSFNINTNELISPSGDISLNPKEANLLKLLLKHKNECVHFDTIYQHVWSYDEVPSEVSLRTYIKKLRQYISKESIVSMKKVGYKLLLS